MPTISVLINARTRSTRLPRKLVKPFAGTTLIDIALKRLDQLEIFEHRYFGVAENELLEKATGLSNIEILKRDESAILPGYNDHKKVFAHYEKVDSDYILWLNPCHPMISIETLNNAYKQVIDSQLNSYTSVIPCTDWIFNENGQALTNTSAQMLSTAHSQTFFKVAHAFHIIRKEFFLQDYQYWTLTHNDPALIEMPENESYDVNTQMEFEIAESVYLRANQ